MSTNAKLTEEKELSRTKDSNTETANLFWYSVFQLKRIWLLVLIPLSFLIILLVRNNKYIAEYIFARGVYKWLSQGLSLLTGTFPFSLMEVEIVVIPIILVLVIINFNWRFIKKLRKKQGGISYMLAKGILDAACIISVILFQFVIFAGVNYYRYSFASYSGLQIQNSTEEDLYNLCTDLAKQAADIREQLHTQDGTEDSSGVLQLSYEWKQLSEKAKENFEDLSKEYPVLDGNYGLSKPVFFSKFMSSLEITGIFWPFTVESNVNVDPSEYSLPATMSHELAHVHGFMREDEANFISYLACTQSDSLEFRYSGIMLALSYAGNELYKQDVELYNKVRSYYDDGMVADLRDEYYYWKHFEDTVVSTISNSVNDNYLKANNQEDGTKSYGRMVDLLLAEYRKNHKEE